MTKKLNSLEALGSIQFNDLAPDRELPHQEEEAFVSQTLEAHFSNKGRGGKTVTVIKGFQGDSSDIKALAKTLKNAIGVGGSVKDGEIIIQGNFREKVMSLLTEMGHQVKRVGG